MNIVEPQLEENANESRLLANKLSGFSSRCRNGQDAPCAAACPYGLDVRGFLTKVRRGSLRAAYNVLQESLLFPETLCSICGHACRGACAAEMSGEAVDLPGIEQAVLRSGKGRGARKFRVPPKKERIAVIGAGLAGAAAAYALGSAGYPVTLYEKEETAGGSLKGIVPDEILLPEMDSVLSTDNITLVAGKEIPDLSELEEFSGVIIATGKGGSTFGLPVREKGLFGEGKVLAVGEVTGAGAFASAALGKAAGTAMDHFLKTGENPRKTVRTDGDAPADVHVRETASYDRTAAEEEAKRCRMCDCTKCVDVCELMKQYKKVPPRFEIDIPGTLNPVDQIRKRSATRLLTSCDDCRLCESVCPENIRTGAALMQVRTAMAHDKALPPAFHDFWLRDMAFSCSQEAEVYLRPENGYLYFPGCLLGASDPETVTGSYELLKKHFPGTGLWLYCCGIPAKWAGETIMEEENTAKIRTVWEEAGRPVFLTACPSCKRNLRDILPMIEVRSVYEVLAEHPEDFDSSILRGEELAVFHPCSSRFDPKEQESVRALAKACGGVLRELENEGDRDGCCGYGGHIYYTNPALYDAISQKRAMADDHPYLTYCANCRDVLSDKGKDCSHILKVLTDRKRTPVPASSLSERRENRKRLKAMLTGTEYKENAMDLVISPELQADCERQLILRSDMEEVIQTCEKENRYLLGEEGVCIGHKKIGASTCWVIWKKTGEQYQIQNAYSHRMVIEGE